MYGARFKSVLFALAYFASASQVLAASEQQLASDILVSPGVPAQFQQELSGLQTKRINIDLDNIGEYATLSVYANGRLLIDNLNVPRKGKQSLSALVHFEQLGEVIFEVKSLTSDVKVSSMTVEDIDSVAIPQYKDISVQAGIDKVSSLKYGGPSIADINNNGYYDFVVNNHNDETSKLYWNNGDGTVTKHHKDLSRWYMHDLHGTSFADYNNTGELDLILSQGGGNGRNPSRTNFYYNNGGEFVMYTGDVGIERGARGRGSKWGDFNGNGLLDFVLINERGLYNEKPQHHFYKNLGDGRFELVSVEGVEAQRPERALITDLNNDGIDDLILYGHSHPMSVWQGNGDFTFTEITDQFPRELIEAKQISAVVDVDINNNGRKDLYFARGKEFEHGRGEAPSVDFDPELKQFSIKPRPYMGGEQWQFTADGPLKLDNYYFLGQFGFRGKDYPIYLGADKNATAVPSGGEFEFSAADAEGWPDDINANGVYFGHLGDGQWRAALVRKGDIFWAYKFNLTGVTSYELDFEPENRNLRDYLLRNDGDKFVDVSKEWNVPTGGNAQGVTTGDFNNNGRQDLLVYRWGNVNHRISDLMLLNNGDRLETVTMHGANDVGGPGYGDMGQAFDFDLSGQVDILSGSEFGEWYLYSNQSEDVGNFSLVRVGYSPRDNIDPLAATVEVKTADNVWRKRVGSAGEVFSQSLLNTVHFGLDRAESIESIKVTWRNGETMQFRDKQVNRLVDTNVPDPESLRIVAISDDIRVGTEMALDVQLSPLNADSSVQWVSSNPDVLKVDEKGVVTATGQVGESAIIIALSQVNSQQAAVELKLVEWTPRPLEAITLTAEQDSMIAGRSQELSLAVSPSQPDDADIVWRSSDNGIAEVSQAGEVTALKAGKVIISASSKANSDISSELVLNIEPDVQGFANIINSDIFANQPLEISESLELEVEYHAGSENTVISADEGGLRVWLRHFESKWMPARDIVLVEPEAIDTESGKLKFTVPLDGVVPTSELPEGHFYLLRATFTASDGKMHSKEIYPLNFVTQ
ncbi:FG-GAP-like repeat-containing protein [Vibrio sp. WXL103]|uniref:FG-GAP-like repeat-containing protein n=1 Tax=Vibrio sp. WXL103 TaxID=3450710 RepID=UPI003EC7D2BC